MSSNRQTIGNLRIGSRRRRTKRNRQSQQSTGFGRR